MVIKIGGNNRTAMVTVPIGKSQDVRTDSSFVDVIVGDPDIADVNPLTDHSLSILAKKIGTTRVSVYSENKKLIGIFDVEVSYDVTRLSNEFKRRFPRARLRAASVNGRIMLTGEVPDAVTLDQAVTIARQFGPDIINSVAVSQPQQVLLEVRFIEIARNAGRDLGVQWNRFGDHSLVNVGNRVPAASLPITQGGSTFNNSGVSSGGANGDASTITRAAEVAGGVLSGGAPFGFIDRPHGGERRLRRRDDQRAGGEGHRPQPGRAQSGGAVRRHRELPGRRRISDPGRPANTGR